MKRLLITGSNRGLGRAIARYFRTRAYRIASLNRTLSGEHWLGEVRCDLAQKEAIPGAVAVAIENLGGRVDVCVLNAAVRKLACLTELDGEAWDESLQVNLSSVFQVAGAVLPSLRQARGSLILIGSQAGGHAFEGGAAYCSSKAAIEMLAEVIARETSAHGVRTSVVTPWAIRNRDDDRDRHKIAPRSVARVVYELVRLPGDAVISRVEIRPADPKPSPLYGIGRLQVQ